MDQLKAIFAIKFKLVTRSDTRNSAEGALRGLFVVFMSILVVYFGTTLGSIYRTTETDYHLIRTLLFPGLHWFLGIIWLFIPISPMGIAQSIHFEGLSLMPINRRTFVGALVVNSLVSPAGLLVPLIIFVTTIAFGKTPILAVIALSVSIIFWIGLLISGQIILLAFGRVLASRRFADIAIIIGTLIGFLFYFSRFFLYTETFSNPNMTAVFDKLKPILTIAKYFPPGLAGSSFNAAASSSWIEFALLFSLFVVEFLALIHIAGFVVVKFFMGELSLGESAKKKKQHLSNGRPAANTSIESFINTVFISLGLSQSVVALYIKEWRYLLREPVYKLRLINSLFVFVYLFGLYFMLKRDSAFEAVNINVVFSLFAYFSIMGQFKLAANKFGMDGEAIESLLLTPVKRAEIMLAKSLIGLIVYQGTSIAILLVGSLFLNISFSLLPLLAVAMVIGALIVEAGGNLLGVYFPYKIIHSSGRRGVPQYEQGGCAFQLIYFLSNLLVSAAAFPLIAVVVLPFYFHVTYLGYMFAPVVIIFSILLLRYSMSFASKKLESREQEIIHLLTRPNE